VSAPEPVSGGIGDLEGAARLGPLARPGGPQLPGLVNLWLLPVAGQVARCEATIDRPLGQLTAGEAVDWLLVIAYAFASGYAAGKLISGILAAAAAHSR
jgi:hypothetical protein